MPRELMIYRAQPFDKSMELLRGIGLKFPRKSLVARFPRAKEWLERYNQEEMIKLLPEPNMNYYANLEDYERKHLAKLVDFLKTKPQASIEELYYMVYSIPKVDGQNEAEIKESQKRFFTNIYLLLFNSKRGPRLSTFLWAVDKSECLRLLDIK